MKTQTFILIGRSGCGKGKQSELLQEYLKKNSPKIPIFYLETGAKLREFIKEKGYTAELSKKIYDKGMLLPEFLAVWSWSSLFIEKYTGNEHILIDGTPRKFMEIAILNSAIKFFGIKKPNVIFLNVDEQWSIARLTGRKRLDDNPDEIKKRLDWYNSDVVPVIDYYKNNPDYNFIEINGGQTPDEVHRDIVKSLALEI